MGKGNNRPVGRIMYRAKDNKGGDWRQIGTVWSSPYPGTMGISLGDRAYKDKPGIEVEEVLELLGENNGFTNIWMNKEENGGDFEDDL